MEEKITKQDVIMAEFMGYEWYEINKPYIAVRKPNGGVKHFQTDWNDLMEVVEKIESLHVANSVVIGGKHCFINIHDKYRNELIYFKSQENTKIEAVYNACLEFIKWYNQQKK